MTPKPMTRFAIHSTEELAEHVQQSRSLRDHVIHHADFTQINIADTDVDGSIIVGCVLTPQLRHDLVARGAAILPPFDDLPYSPYRAELYSCAELLDGYEASGYVGTRDFLIYAHFDRARRAHGSLPPLHESLAQRLHDHAVDDALHRFVTNGVSERVIGVMGGHGTRRDSADFERVVRLCRRLTQRGYVIATGGGPGIMEAGNLGAFLANFSDDAVVDATLEILADAPSFPSGEDPKQYLTDIERYIAVGYAARRAAASDDFAQRFGCVGAPAPSLAVPTWFYGHEPSNVFSDHVAKYFSNGLREDVLLAISRAGVVFAPGSAGTLQEVFMDLAQNHYATFVDRSPMIFLGDDPFLTRAYHFVRDFAEQRGAAANYADMVGLFTDIEDVCAFLAATPPRRRTRTRPLYELL